MSAAPQGAPQAIASSALLPVALLGAVLAAIVAIYYPSFAELVALWAGSETYTHGFLVLPITLALVWRRRRALADLPPRPAPWGLLVLGGLSIVWLLATRVGVNIVEQLAVVAMWPAAVVTLLGRRLSGEIAFPLAFLVFAVPVGEVLIPTLMDFTADFAVSALLLSGIPVFRDGWFISIPSGDFEVAKACSGIRYLTASVTIGALYAYLSYRSYWRRAVFIAAAALMPIAANGLRAYGIIMLAHLSDMRFAVGVDHLIYGWLFFGVVILLLLWLGSFFRDGADDRGAAPPREDAPHATAGRFVATSALALVALASGPLVDRLAWSAASGGAGISIELPLSLGGWSQTTPATPLWQPRYSGPVAAAQASYTNGRQRVDVYIARYDTSAHGAEVVNVDNTVYDAQQWFPRALGEVTIGLDGGERLRAVTTDIYARNGAQRLAWHWYVIGRRVTHRPSVVKLLELLSLLRTGAAPSAVVIVSSPYVERSVLAAAELEAFVREAYPRLNGAAGGQ